MSHSPMPRPDAESLLMDSKWGEFLASIVDGTRTSRYASAAAGCVYAPLFWKSAPETFWEVVYQELTSGESYLEICAASMVHGCGCQGQVPTRFAEAIAKLRGKLSRSAWRPIVKMASLKLRAAMVPLLTGVQQDYVLMLDEWVSGGDWRGVSEEGDVPAP